MKMLGFQQAWRQSLAAAFLALCLLLAACVGPDIVPPSPPVVRGAVDLPEDLPFVAEEGVAVGKASSSYVGPHGAFSIEIVGERLEVVSVVYPNGYFQMDVLLDGAPLAPSRRSPGAGEGTAFASLSDRSTAETLVFLNPYLFCPEPQRAEQLMTAIGRSPEVVALADALAATAGTESPMSQPTVERRYLIAVVNVANRVSGGTSPPRPYGANDSIETVLGTMGAGGEQTTLVMDIGLDNARTGVDIEKSRLWEEGTLVIRPTIEPWTQSVYWLFNVTEIDTAAYASWSDLEQTLNDEPVLWKDGGYEAALIQRERSAFDLPDIVSFAIEEGVETAMREVTEEASRLFDLPSPFPEEEFAIPVEGSAAYEVRATCGGFADTEEFEELLPLLRFDADHAALTRGQLEWTRALILNTVYFAFQVVDVIVDLRHAEDLVVGVSWDIASQMYQALLRVAASEDLRELRELPFEMMGLAVELALEWAGRGAAAGTASLLDNLVEGFTVVGKAGSVLSHVGNGGQALCNVFFGNSPVERTLVIVRDEGSVVPGQSTNEPTAYQTYLPLQEGNTWSYRVTAPSLSASGVSFGSVLRYVATPRTYGGERVHHLVENVDLLVEWTGGTPACYEVERSSFIEETRRSLEQVGFEVLLDKDPACSIVDLERVNSLSFSHATGTPVLLKIPLEVGTTWSYRLGEATYDAEVVGREDLDIDSTSGTRKHYPDCWLVKQTAYAASAGFAETSYAWYCEGIGLVKMVSEVLGLPVPAPPEITGDIELLELLGERHHIEYELDWARIGGSTI